MDYFWGASEWASHGAVENNGELSATISGERSTCVTRGRSGDFYKPNIYLGHPQSTSIPPK